ncbi:MAG: xanthine dehydrogenase accessory protein XdhC [Marinosulfonomonas sp.]|nr:xanthine dehydrogenase accessory protein XdhC [Marinosulfonomonas sp.]
MSFRLAEIANSLSAYGNVVRVLVTGTKGSAPRDAGAAMLVWRDGQSGTIGGGALEYQATKRAREMLDTGLLAAHITQPLGPALGQCCGGSVTLVYERFNVDNLPLPNTRIFVRPVDATANSAIPALLQRRIDAAQNAAIAPTLTAGWLAESIGRTATPVWIFGAGHVGRALAQTLAPLADFNITLIDTEAARMPMQMSDNITTLTAQNMAGLIKHASDNTHHFIMTMDHAIDLEICHQLLNHRFAYAGLIGSKTKWARFGTRLESLGHTQLDIARITCPIGDPALGKEPQAIAVGIAHALLLERAQLESTTGIAQRTGEI